MDKLLSPLPMPGHTTEHDLQPLAFIQPGNAARPLRGAQPMGPWPGLAWCGRGSSVPASSGVICSRWAPSPAHMGTNTPFCYRFAWAVISTAPTQKPFGD